MIPELRHTFAPRGTAGKTIEGGLFKFFVLVSVCIFGGHYAHATQPLPPTICLGGCSANVDAVDLETTSARFIGAGGSNANDGRSHATRWANTAPAKNLPQGTDVYLLAGLDNGKRTWSVNWSGTSQDPVVVGCYYLDQANGNQATSCSEGNQAFSQPKPTIRGTYEAGCRQNRTCPVNAGNAIPASHWDGLLNIAGSNIVVQDINVHDSSGAAIKFYAAYSRYENLKIERVNILRAVKAGVWFNQAKPNSELILRDSTLELVALSNVDGIDNNWPACVSTDSDGAWVNALYENNFLKDCAGEGLTFLRMRGGIMRKNTVTNTRRPLIYLDNASDSIVENNVVAGNGFLETDESYGAGIIVTVEPYGNSTYDAVNNVIRNNLVANTRGALGIIMRTSSPYTNGNPKAEGRKVGARVYGNTFMQNKAAFLFSENLESATNRGTIEIQNNVFAGSNRCNWPSGVGSIDSNLYGVNPNDADCLGSRSVIGDPAISVDYTQVNADNIPSSNAFAPPANSNAAQSGLALSNQVIDASAYPVYAEFSRDLCALNANDWEKGLAFDYQCKPRASSPTLGALEIQ